MLGNGKAVDLFKLFFSVNEYGGYETVSNYELWDSVAEEFELGTGVGSAVKLVYAKYLYELERWLQRIVKDKKSKGRYKQSASDLSVLLMDLEPGVKAFLSELSDNNKEDGKFLHIDFTKNDLVSTGIEKLGNGIEARSFVDLNVVDANEVIAIDAKDNEDLASDEMKGSLHGRKRKRDCFSQMLNWVTEVAKDPCDSAIGPLPERCKWKHYGVEQVWKQVLLIREAMFLKGNTDPSVEQSIWQKQKMHPTMYDDYTGTEKLRFSQRILSAKESRAFLALKNARATLCLESSSSGTHSDSEDPSDSVVADSLVAMWFSNRRQKRVPIGPCFQAVIPEWTGELHKSDSKWLGSRVWPLEEGVPSKYLIERDCIGKGRQESCGCQFPGSLECARFHIGEKRVKLKRELSTAFYTWKVDKMGEEVALSWTKEEEKKFQAIVKSNPASLDKCFWDDMFRSFPRKRKQELVSYYFNVFLLNRRGYQNRSTPRNIDSDDDESELASIAHGSGLEAIKSSSSIFCSPKKVHLNFR